MPDRLIDPTEGPDHMLSDTLPPSRGQLHTIAVLALQLLGVGAPQHRLDASIAIVRLHKAVQQAEAGEREIEELIPF